MIICHCEGISHRAIDRAIEAGASTVDQITESCGAGGDCGGCHASLLRRLEQHDAATAVAPVRIAFT